MLGRKNSFPQRIRNIDINTVKTNRWLKSAVLMAETEGLIVAAKEQSLQLSDKYKKWIKPNW